MMSSSPTSFLSTNVKRYYDLTLKTDLKWANGSDGVEEYFNCQTLLNFEAIKKYLEMNIPHWTPDKDDMWYFKAVGCLVPLFCACDQELKSLDKDFQQYSKYFEWTSHPEMFEASFKLIRNSSNTSAIESVLLMSSVLERSLGNLLVSVPRDLEEVVKIPALLRDLISMPQLMNYLGTGCIIFLKILLGTPLSLNLRNVVWHGFINPEELSATLASTLFFVIASIGQYIENSPVDLVKRPLLRLKQAQLIKRNFCEDQIFVNKINTDSVNALILNSNIFPMQHREIFLRVVRYNSNHEAGSALILGLPFLESILRTIFVIKNGCPERLLTADANCLYTTLNEILQQNKLEDGSDNKIQEELGEDLLTVLFDLLVLPEGPRIRDKFSHGEVNFSLGKTENEDLLHLSHHLVNIITILLWKYVDNLNCSNFSEIASSYDNYTSVFHPSSLLSKSVNLCITLLKKIPQAGFPDHESQEYDYIDFCDHLSTDDHSKLSVLFDQIKEHFVLKNIELVLENSDMDSVILQSLRCCKGKTLYRPREEYEILNILQQIVDQINLSAERTLSNMAEKLQQHDQKLLRSRQRNTYRRMLEILPRMYKTFMGVLLLVTYILINMENLPGNALYSKRLKILKRCLKNCENIATFVQSDCNKWVEVAGCLEGMEKVVDDYPLF